MKKTGLLIIPLAAVLVFSGCATPLGTMMEAPVQDIDVAEVAANLPKGKAMLYSHRYQSLQPNTTTKIGNDSSLTVGAAKELVGVLQLINQHVDGRFDKVAEEGLEALTATLALALAKRIQASSLLPKRYEALVEEGVIAAPELELAQRQYLALLPLRELGQQEQRQQQRLAELCTLQVALPYWFARQGLQLWQQRSSALSAQMAQLQG